jgi:hypothetical protein
MIGNQLYFASRQADHGANHIKLGTDLKVGDSVVVHVRYNGQPVQMTATVSHVDVQAETMKFTEWGDDPYPWGDYGLTAYKPGTTLNGQDMAGLFHQQHWLERVAVN